MRAAIGAAISGTGLARIAERLSGEKHGGGHKAGEEN